MIRLVSFLGLMAVLLTTGTAAQLDDLAGRTWDVAGRLRVTIGGTDRLEEPVTGTAVFSPPEHDGDPWCVIDLSWDEVLRFIGSPRKSPTGRLVLDPGEDETLPSIERAFGAAIRDRLEDRLGTSSLDALDVRILILRTTVSSFRKAGQDQLRVGVDVLFRYTGWKGDRHARTHLKVAFDGSGPAR